MAQMSALWYLMFVTLVLTVAESQSTLNFTADIEAAMVDMRAKSYFGFIILLKVLARSPNFIHSPEVTFLMPTDEELAASELNLDHTVNFILTHTIPSPLVFNNMMHFPNGTLVPTSLPGRMLTVTTNHGLFLNNARVVNANVCVNSVIKCHGISSTISFDDHRDAGALPDGDAPPPPTGSMGSQKTGRSSMFHLKRNSTLS